MSPREIQAYFRCPVNGQFGGLGFFGWTLDRLAGPGKIRNDAHSLIFRARSQSAFRVSVADLHFQDRESFCKNATPEAGFPWQHGC
jgi:hypothetical protein